MKKTAAAAAKSEFFWTAQLTLAIAMSALINLNVFPSETNGFVIAVDVVVFSVAVYLYQEKSIFRIALIAAAASPVTRMLVMFSENGDLRESMIQTLPDGIFFLAYGAAFSLLMHYGFKDECDLASFVIAAFTSDLSGNMTELLLRSVIVHHFTFQYMVIGVAIFAAAFRTVLAYIIIWMMDWYTRNKLKEEKLREYRELTKNAAIIQDEIHIMNKNMAEVEEVMKKGYDLYRTLDENGYPQDIVDRTLDLAKLTHEIKGDYRNIITVLSGLYDEDAIGTNMTVEEIIRLEESNAESFISGTGYNIRLAVDADADVTVQENYKLMSVIRNLLTNAIEAICEESSNNQEPEPGLISIKAHVENGDICVIEIKDNGPGIPEKKREKIFREGYSTKFNQETGYIQRGIGLSIVKTYVEDDMCGRLMLAEDSADGGHFIVEFPVNVNKPGKGKE